MISKTLSCTFLSSLTFLFVGPVGAQQHSAQSLFNQSCVTSLEFIPLSERSSIVSGRTRYDATDNLRRMLQSGARCFRFAPGTYNISGSLPIPSNSHLFGNGAIIRARSEGWTLTPHEGFGLFNFYNAQNVTIEGFHFYGTKNADIDHTPKLIYLEKASNIDIRDNWFDHSSFEGIWEGDDSLVMEIRIHDNNVTDVGHPAGKFVGLPAIQATVSDSIISNNTFSNVGIAVGVSGRRVVVTGNRVNGFTQFGITTGDGGTGEGVVISGNSIEFIGTPSNHRYGLFLGTTTYPVLATGNTIRLTVHPDDLSPIGINVVGGQRANISNNVVDIEGHGSAIGIYFQPSTGGAMTAVADNNSVYFAGDTKSTFKAFEATPGSPNAMLTVLLQGNHVFGATATTAFAYDAFDLHGGKLTAVFINNTKDGGTLRIGSRVVSSDHDNNLAFSYDYTFVPQ